MREIKFRAWDKANTIMLFFSFNENTSDYPVEFPENNLSENEGYVIMQYTGLKDKNEKEGYHKDIVKDPECNMLLVIDWLDEGRWILQPVGRTSSFYALPLESLRRFEVIGNIYENKDLLEVPQ